MEQEGLTNIWEEPALKVSDEQINVSLTTLLRRIDLYESMTKKARSTNWFTSILQAIGILSIVTFSFLIIINPANLHRKGLAASYVQTKKIKCNIICKDERLSEQGISNIHKESISNVLKYLEGG